MLSEMCVESITVHRLELHIWFYSSIRLHSVLLNYLDDRTTSLASMKCCFQAIRYKKRDHRVCCEQTDIMPTAVMLGLILLKLSVPPRSHNIITSQT